MPSSVKNIRTAFWGFVEYYNRVIKTPEYLRGYRVEYRVEGVPPVRLVTCLNDVEEVGGVSLQTKGVGVSTYLRQVRAFLLSAHSKGLLRGAEGGRQRSSARQVRIISILFRIK